MDIQTLKQTLLQDTSKIEQLLIYYGFDRIKVTNTEIRCSHDCYGNASSVRIKLVEGLPSTDFSKSISGDIFTVIVELRKIPFFEVICCCKKMMNIDESFTFKRTHIFGGVYNNIKKTKKEQDHPITYPEVILHNYESVYSDKFCKDGISLNSQKFFGIGYDVETHRITVPWRSSDGKLLGIMGRYNGDTAETHAKWFPVISFSKSNCLYGFYENYVEIVKNETIYIGESEKFVMQLHTLGIKNCVALGGNAITDRRIKELIATTPKNIIFCFDEGLDIKQIINECLKFKQLGNKFGINVGYILDVDKKWLKEGTKNSPSDLGYKVWLNLIENCVIYV